MNYNEFKEVLRNEVQKYFETDVQLTTTVEDIRSADITNRSTGRARMDIGYGK